MASLLPNHTVTSVHDSVACGIPGTHFIIPAYHLAICVLSPEQNSPSVMVSFYCQLDTNPWLLGKRKPQLSTCLH